MIMVEIWRLDHVQKSFQRWVQCPSALSQLHSQTRQEGKWPLTLPVPFCDISIIERLVISQVALKYDGVGRKGAKYLSVTLRNMLASSPHP